MKYKVMEASYCNMRQGDIIELPDNAIMFDHFTNQSGKSEWTTFIRYLVPVDIEMKEKK